MAKTKSITRIRGEGGLTIVTDMLTLSSGAATFQHGMRKFRVFVSALDSSAPAAETFGVIGTPNTDGWLTATNGQSTVKSSNGSSAEKVFVVAFGYKN